MSRAVAAGLLALAVAGCSDGSNGAGAGGGGGAAPLPTIFGGDRPTELFVPGSYDAAVPTPLLILLHGHGASGALQDLFFGLRALTDARGVLYLHPDGTLSEDGRRFWNATDACCDFYGTGVDDSSYLRGLIDEVSASYNVDPKRIYFAGHSNGGFMSYRMACDHADVVAAIAGLAGATWMDWADCNASEPVHVLHIHGSADDTVLYDGDAGYPGAVESVAQWASHDGCSAGPSTGEPLDLEADQVGAETVVSRYEGCAVGGSAELWTMQGAGHIPSLSDAFAPSMLDFLLERSKP